MFSFLPGQAQKIYLQQLQAIQLEPWKNVTEWVRETSFLGAKMWQRSACQLYK